MNPREIERLHWMRQLSEQRTTQRKVAEALGLTSRHVRRLYEAYSASGAAGLTSRRRGAKSNRSAPEELRANALGIVRSLYADFGPTLAQEKLAELHGLKLSVETLRKWMVADGLWSTRRERRSSGRHRRQQSALRGTHRHPTRPAGARRTDPGDQPHDAARRGALQDGSRRISGA